MFISQDALQGQKLFWMASSNYKIKLRGDKSVPESPFPFSVLSEQTFLGEHTIEIDKHVLIEALSYFKQAGYVMLIDLTAVDFLDPEAKTKIVYFLHDPQTLKRIRVFTFVKRDESVPSAISLWPGANWYEREIYDLFGVTFIDHPNLTRILMPDDWSGHPLRKDYALTEESVEFKHGVAPKIPSKIIPHIKTHLGNTTHVKNY